MSLSSVIEFKHISKIYTIGDHKIDALNDIDITIDIGELIAIIGTSGSGKSTMLNLLGLLDRPSSGSYKLDNHEVSQLTDDQQASIRNKMIGFIFQSFFLLPKITALQNVGLPLLYRHVKPGEAKQRAQTMLEKVGMARFIKHKPSELSGGQQQRVAIARALVGHPEIILADEPTGALDSKTSQEVVDLLIDLNKNDNTTVIIVTHDPNIARQCRREIRLQDGKII